jgi:hypothetical protein
LVREESNVGSSVFLKWKIPGGPKNLLSAGRQKKEKKAAAFLGCQSIVARNIFARPKIYIPNLFLCPVQRFSNDF